MEDNREIFASSSAAQGTNNDVVVAWDMSAGWCDLTAARRFADARPMRPARQYGRGKLRMQSKSAPFPATDSGTWCHYYLAIAGRASPLAEWKRDAIQIVSRPGKFRMTTAARGHDRGMSCGGE